MTVLKLVMLLGYVIVGQCAIFTHKNNYLEIKTLRRLNLKDDHDQLYLSRVRRATTSTTNPSPGKIQHNDFVLKGSDNYTQAYVHWSGKGKSEGVFVLTLRFNPLTGSVVGSQMWKSLDYGKTFVPYIFGINTKVSYFYVSKTDHTKMLFVDKENKVIYISTDELLTHKNDSLPASSDDILLHPQNSDWLLLYDENQRQLWISMDFGHHWNVLQNDVNRRFFWGVPGFDDEKIVHMEIQQQASAHAFYKSCTIPECQNSSDTISNSLGPFVSTSLLVIKEYIFVQKSHADGSDTHMMVSYNRSLFKHALFPEEIKTRDFIVVDASEGQVFLAVSAVGGANLYLSDPTGRFYILSLPRIHHRALKDWFEVDLHKVNGVPATYLANQQLNTLLSEGKKVRTYISVDRGGNWSRLKPQCQKNDESSLVLRLDLGSYNQDWIVSHEDSPGLVIAHGQFSEQYDIDTRTMSVLTSKDGGWCWTEAPFKGIYRFNILDHGGILTAIFDKDHNNTNMVHYSYDYGTTWVNDTFGKDLLAVDGVINEPDINTLLVSIYGHGNSTRSSPWIMVQLNFSEVLSQKCNPDSDYTPWSPSDHDANTGEQCILGVEMQYQRRKESAVCFMGEDYKRPVKGSFCNCTMEDFECDFGYNKNLTSNTCVKEPWFDDSYLAADCALGTFINKTSGYRKVASDKCVNGIEKNSSFIPQKISCPLWGPYRLHLTPNVTVVASSAPISFHLTQARGSKVNTSYKWNFGDGMVITLPGFENASHQVHQFSKPGMYLVNVTGMNSNGSSSSENVSIRVEKPIRSVALFGASETKKGYSFLVNVATDIDHSSHFNSLHYVWRFGDEKEDENGVLTWEPQARHTYNSTGDFVITVFAVNAVSAMPQELSIKVYGNATILRLNFSDNINRVFMYFNSSAMTQDQFLDFLRREIATVVGIDYNRLCMFLYKSSPLVVDMMVTPPPDPKLDLSIKQIVNTIHSMVTNGTLIIYKPFTNEIGSFVVLSAVDIEVSDGGSHPSDPAKVPNYRAVYIALPVVILTALITVLVLMYYRSRFRSIRHYSMLNQREDSDALLDDEDEPPLDLRSDGRNENFSRDDAMLDLGTGSHLVMVTGGGGDSAENC